MEQSDVGQLRRNLAESKNRILELEQQLALVAPAPEGTLNLTTIDQLHEGIQVLDREWRYLYLNDAACGQIRTSRGDVLGRAIYECFAHMDLTALFATMAQVMADRTPRQIEHQLHFADGGRAWFDLFVEPHSAGILIRSMDIGKRKDLEADFLHVQKLESIGQMAAGVAHDFNNQLGVMMAFSEITLDLSPESELTARENLQHVLFSIELSTSLTRQLLAFGRKQHLDLQLVNLNDVLARSAPALQRSLGEGIYVDYFPQEDLYPIKVDPTQMDQILLNLCLNARDAMLGGGAITIETSNVDCDIRIPEFGPEMVPGAYVLLTVSDTGEGMSTEIRDRVFEPFFTTKAAGRGCGLGLSSVQGIVRQSRGHIAIYSEPLMGTTVKIYIPAVTGESVRPGPRREPEALVAGSGEVVLLVEDDQLLRKAYKKGLENAGYRVVTTETAEEARAIFSQAAREFHLFLSDVVLPQGSGAGLYYELCALNPGLRAIFMSGYSAKSVAHRASWNESLVLLQKPISLHRLTSTVQSVLA